MHTKSDLKKQIEDLGIKKTDTLLIQKQNPLAWEFYPIFL